MSNVKEKADEILTTIKVYIQKAYSYEIEYDKMEIEERDLIHFAILSTENTIKVLEKYKELKESIDYITNDELRIINTLIHEQIINTLIQEQNELLTELKNRL